MLILCPVARAGPWGRRQIHVQAPTDRIVRPSASRHVAQDRLGDASHDSHAKALPPVGVGVRHKKLLPELGHHACIHACMQNTTRARGSGPLTGERSERTGERSEHPTGERSEPPTDGRAQRVKKLRPFK